MRSLFSPLFTLSLILLSIGCSGQPSDSGPADDNKNTVVTEESQGEDFDGVLPHGSIDPDLEPTEEQLADPFWHPEKVDDPNEPGPEAEFPIVEPMTREMYREITSLDWTGTFRFLVWERRDPESRSITHSIFQYIPSAPFSRLVAECKDSFTGHEYYARLPNEIDYISLLNYIDEHSDYFFNHEEFEGIEKGKRPVSEDFDYIFAMTIPSYGIDVDSERPIDYEIAKTVPPGGEIPEELQHVKDILNEWTAETLATEE
ncbi:MAG TPA: hypothetical protein VGB30_07900 [bacterium]|jgi:hypothetical protein